VRAIREMYRRASLCVTTTFLLFSAAIVFPFQQSHEFPKLFAPTFLHRVQKLGLFKPLDIVAVSRSLAEPLVEADSAPADIVKLRPNPLEYERIDTKMLAKEYKHWVKDHALHDTVAGPGKVEAYEIYQKNNTNELYCLVKFGKSLNGHPGIVHGGITSLVFDNTFGWLFLALKIKPAVTANLVINYRSPIYANTCCILKAKLLKIEGRKLYMNATLEDTNGKLLAESTTLFIIMKQNMSTFLQKLWFDLKTYFS
jgi:acyl-coenzyme A thioesterase PaaI-like protein